MIIDRLKGSRILVVEDEAMIAMLLETVLQQAGCLVFGPFPCVRRALLALADAEVDGALLDVQLRGETVYPVAEHLSAAGIPFMFLTGYGADSLIAPFNRCRCMTKPFSANKLRAALAEIVGEPPCA